MSSSVHILLQAASSETLFEDFRAIRESETSYGEPRYTQLVLKGLAQFIVGQGGSSNKDTAIFELSHLIFALKTGDELDDRRNMFFFGVEKASASSYRHYFQDRAVKLHSLSQSISVSETGISIGDSKENFDIQFQRIPFLVALYEFLAGMEAFSFYAEFQSICDELQDSPHILRAVKVATNKITSRLRKYRIKHLVWARQEEKFDRIYGFLKEASPDGELHISDDSILDFWVSFSDVRDFKRYKSVFDAFVNLLDAMEQSRCVSASSAAMNIGSDFEDGEVDLEPSDICVDADWCDPFQTLDQEPASLIKFFKHKGEKQVIELLMHYGPVAVKLLLAFYRLDVFSPIQAGITTDLQVKRGCESIKQRLASIDAESYEGKLNEYSRIQKHVMQLQQAVYHVVSEADEVNERISGNVIAFDKAVVAHAPSGNSDGFDNCESRRQLNKRGALAFKQLTRAGFDHEAFSNEDRLQGFREAIPALLSIGTLIQQFIKSSEQLDGHESNLCKLFSQDKDMFREHFQRIYGDVL